MKQFSYVITDKEGIHARPAGVVVAEAKKYSSNFTIENKGKSADLKESSVLCLYVLNAVKK